MKALDRMLQRWRIGIAAPHVRPGSRVLDVGCHDGALFRQLGDRVGEGVGIDAELDVPGKFGNARLLPGHFPEDLPDEEPFDAITMLAVLEHVPTGAQRSFAEACAQYLKPGGVLVVTTPSPMVDTILDVLAFLKLIDGMSLEQHYGFEPGDTPGIFEGLLELRVDRRFQLGLNRLFVFQKPTT